MSKIERELMAIETMIYVICGQRVMLDRTWIKTRIISIIDREKILKFEK